MRNSQSAVERRQRGASFSICLPRRTLAQWGGQSRGAAAAELMGAQIALED
ncbi:MAG: hypothetical protein MHMPM18_001932 [Marteilia pararefringens]